MHLRRSFPLLVSLTLAASALAFARPQLAQRGARIPSGVPVRWGLVLDCDRPFLDVGEVLHARGVLVNETGQDAVFTTFSGGGNGCQVEFSLRDSADRVVWEPGSIQGGVFSGPPCLPVQRSEVLPAFGTLPYAAAIPLVYQNRDGNGVLGDPLPSGQYQLALEVRLFGPEPPPGTLNPGLGYEARVPIRIE